MKLKTDDPTFTTTKIVTLPSAALADHWIFWLFAHTCRHYTQTTSSFGDLKGLVHQSHILVFKGDALIGQNDYHRS